MEKIILAQLLESKSVHEDLLHLVSDIENVAVEIIRCFKRGGKILVCGNGGSASDAQHFVAEIINKPAIALTTNDSTITAIGNDFGYEQIFWRQLDGLATKKDIVIGITTSGTSRNVILGIQNAKGRKIKTVVLMGSDPSILDEIADITLKVPSSTTARIQEAHILMLHIIADLVNGSFETKVKYKYGPETEI